jgi:hypothetical protein
MIKRVLSGERLEWLVMRGAGYLNLYMIDNCWIN